MNTPVFVSEDGGKIIYILYRRNVLYKIMEPVIIMQVMPRSGHRYS
jgi:hypothetical protein